VDALGTIEILVVHKTPVGREVFEAGDDLEVVATARGGTENVDKEAAADHDVMVLHAPGRNANAVAYGLAAHRRIPHFTSTTAAGEWTLEFDPRTLPHDVEELTVGIVGFGNIGRKVAERYGGFGPDVLAYDPCVADETVRNHGAEPADFEGLVISSDIVTLHVRLSEETRHMIDAEVLGDMKDSALLVNTARGNLVDEESLITSLRNNEIGGVALDVFEEEPLSDDHPLLKLEAALLSPHTAGSTRNAVLNGSRIVARDIVAILEGEEPSHRIV